jgi:3-methyl-2-oxobutanoate hydroxymethyltransferase
MLTAYDAWMARILAGTDAVDVLLVGDSLGMVELGHETTVPVTMEDMIHHTRAVRRGAPQALVVADMPFLSHQLSAAQALRNAGRLMQEAGASAVKLEGGASAVEAGARIVGAGIPVMGHLGLLPQSVHQLGGYKRQATDPAGQQQLLADAVALEQAGAFAIVLECIPETLASEVTARVEIPTIGIGSGAGCDGQVLVTHDMLGLTGDGAPSFVKRYAALGEAIAGAAAEYAREIRAGEYTARRTVLKSKAAGED